MTRIPTFTTDGLKRTARVVRIVESRHGLEGLQDVDAFEGGFPQIRYVKTATNSTFPTYPTAPANKFLVRLGEYTFDNKTLTNETALFTPYAPALYRMMYSEIGWLPLGFVCRALVHHGRWFLLTDTTATMHKAVTNATISAGNSGPVTIYKNGAAVPGWIVTAHLNWMHGGTSIAANKQILIKWFPDEGSTGLWGIINRQCP